MSKLEIISKDITPIAETAKGVTIKTEKDKEQASVILASLTIQRDRLIADREAITKPMNEALKGVRAKYKPFEEVLDVAISDLRNKIGGYQTEQLKLQKVEEDKIASRVGEGRGKLKFETAQEKISNLPKVAEKTGAISFRTDKVLKIVDSSKIPMEYYDLNKSRLLNDMKAGKEIVGVLLEEVQTVITKR